MRLLVALFIALVAIAFVACTPNPTPVPPMPTANAQPSSIDYYRSGGFIGANDHLSIDLNGHATLTRRTGNSEFDLTHDQLTGIHAAFQSAGFVALPENAMPAGMPADGFSYTITYQGHTVKTADTAVPQSLDTVLVLLNQIVDSKGK
jgi:hypothetical protein